SEFINEVKKYLTQNIEDSVLIKIRNIITDRIFTLSELSTIEKDGEIQYFSTKPNVDISKAVWKDSDNKKTQKNLETIIELLDKVSENNFTKDNIKNAIWNFAEKEGRGAVLWPMRYSLSGKDKSPDPFELSEVLGKKETIERLHSVAVKLS
ncbi:hypothetical protein IT397_03345, partial [Candidatus Nomurabacteria bacterium]|nr:hypothetical protein [Candidatus Nomurabacteria bacterium]